MGIELRFVDGNGVESKVLPDYRDLSISPVLHDYGTVSFTYPRSGKNFDLLYNTDEFEVAVYVDGVKYPKLGGILKDASGDDILEEGMFQFSGMMYLTLLDEGRVFPKNWPSYSPTDPTFKIPDATAGFLMLNFIGLAKQRGACQQINTSSFTATHDSNGVAWTKQISLEFKPGPTLTDVLKSLQGNGLCDFEMDGKSLRLYNPGTLSVDRTLTDPQLVFRAGRDVRDSPRKRTTREIVTALLAAGSEESGVYHEEVDATAVANRRRIEGYISNGNVSDAGTLNAWSELELSRTTQPKMEKTHGLEFTEPNSPFPVLDFNVGDWAYSDVGQGLERLRIKQWVLSSDDSGRLSGSVILNDLFAEASERLSKRIDGIIGGTSITGESKAEEVIPEEVVDQLAPKAPTGLTLSSNAYVDRDGTTQAQVSATWLQVTQNEDGTVLSDLDAYQVRWRYKNDLEDYWRYTGGAVTTGTSWSPVASGLVVEVQVRAYDRAGNSSAWMPTVPVSITSGVDTTPPEIPETPTGDNFLGLARISISGKTASGAAWAKDYNYTEVHASLTANFTPVDTGLPGSTHIDSRSSAGRSLTKVDYGSRLYVKLRSVDNSGNKSAFTPEISITVSQVVSSDVFDGAIGTAKLADLAVTTAKINLLAVNSAQIGSLEVGKLIGGKLLGQVILGNRITTAETGTRMEINQIGLQAWNGLDKTIDLNGVNNLLTGVLQTALPGNRRIVIGSSGGTGKIEFFAPDGTVGELGVFTGDNVNHEAVRIGLRIPNVSEFWNKIQISEGDTITAWSAAVKAVIGGGGTQLQSFEVNWTDNRKTPADPFFDEKRRMYIDKTDFLVYDGVSTNPRIWVNPTSIALRDPNNYSRFDASPTNTILRDQENRARLQISGTDVVLRSSNGTAPSATDRLQISNNASTGFVVREPSGSTRLWIRDNLLTIWGNDDLADIELRPDSFLFTPGAGDKRGFLEILTSFSYGQSARLRLRTNPVSSTDGAFWEGIFKVVGGKFEFRTGDDMNWAGTHAGRIDSASDIVAVGGVYAEGFKLSSDEGLKRGIKTLEPGASAKIRKVRAARYKRNSRPNGDEEIGLIAQEVQKVAPEIISEDENGMLVLDLYGMATILWASNQELIGRLEALEGKTK